MKLTSAQLEQFELDGYLFFPSLFTPEEVKTLADEVPRLFEIEAPWNVREKGSHVVRTNFAAHMLSEVFARLARHPRMVEPVAGLDRLYLTAGDGCLYRASDTGRHGLQG